MANEAEIINNPDSTPGAVSTGYQLQNLNLVSQRTGIDKTYVSGGVGKVTIEISGPVDVNGVLYNIKSQTVLTPPSAGRYYITLQGAGTQYLTPTLGTSAGTFDPLKNARYDASNCRILNWVIYFDGTTCYANRLLTPESEHTEIKDLDTPEETWITSNTTWTAKRTKYYTMYVTGSGGDGGSAAANTIQCGGGGGAGSTGVKRIFVKAGTTWTATFSATTGGNTTFTDGVTTLIAGNGADGGGNSTTTASGGITAASSGFDVVYLGGQGDKGVATLNSVSFAFGGQGGASYYGGGGSGGCITSTGAGASACEGRAYGSGGGGAANNGSIGTSTGGLGKVGIIRIIG